MLALRSTGTEPAQFVFDRGQLAGPKGLLAFVVSASQGDRTMLEAQVLMQARKQLGLTLQAVQTVVEKRATFACTPNLVRPPPWIAPGLLACGDYLAGPYPATLEGAVRSGLAAGAAVSSGSESPCR
jgi:predicted NAD/FAD-dependent oxidoreductase